MGSLWCLLVLITLSGTELTNASTVKENKNIKSVQSINKAQIMESESSRSLWKTESENKL